MHLLLYIQLNLCLVLVVHTTCPPLCTCVYHNRSNGTELRTVLCKDPVITTIPVKIPPDTVKFRLERTPVSRVPRGAFSNLPELTYLWLTYNSISSLHPRSFANLSALHELRLDGNLLSVFPWAGLRDMPRLRTLGLHNNRLSRVPTQAARFLGNVTYLDLSSNRLSTLPNELITLWPLGTPRNPSRPQRSVVLGLQDNPWVCDCRLSVLLDVIKGPQSSLVLLDRFLTCSGPTELAGILFQNVDLSRCQRPTVLTSVTKVTTLLGRNVILRCYATGFPTPALIWIKSAAPNVYNTDLQESPRVGTRWSVISLNGISYRDAGEYRCRAENMAGVSEASISLNVVGVVGGDSVSKRSDKIKTTTKFPPLERRLNQEFKINPNMLVKNLTALLSSPRRVLTRPKDGRDKMKRDQTAGWNLQQS
ncbi:leucine-rich repeat, immunoglobulin-like domain and transmembrane domain-containing protein 3b [Chanos chanos]|uniref:leucine-rich repeat, immunoglobulin-like domain and transmembrane domain-containing protein 3b n=1 Tax=Chanos chanos TaxID=29144 RepID=UPI0011F1CF34|nr:leucine-rich repeat, immunoglobulin-like domain and transmembrane domain-containing protein 3 [Chanos chanos]